MKFAPQSVLMLFTLALGFPVLTGFGPSRPVPLPAAEMQKGFTTAPRADVFRLWPDPSSTVSNPKVWLGTDTDSLATAGVQVWNGGTTAHQVYVSRDTSVPAGNSRTDLTAVAHLGDRVFIALRGAPGSRPTKGGSWIESSSDQANWQVEFTGTGGWNFLVRGFQSLASGEVAAWGTSDADTNCGGRGLAPWTAVRDVTGRWTQVALPSSFCDEIPLAMLPAPNGRGVWFATQVGVLEGAAGSQNWKRKMQWNVGQALQGKAQGDSAILLFGDGSLRQWHPGTDVLQFIANAPAGALLPEARQTRWFEGRSGWDATAQDSAVWITSAYHERKHCHRPIIVIPMPGPMGNPCQDLITEVKSWTGREWKVVASAYGNNMSAPLLTDEGQLLVPSNGEVKTLKLNH